jgi:hypothetical protein
VDGIFTISKISTPTGGDPSTVHRGSGWIDIEGVINQRSNDGLLRITGLTGVPFTGFRTITFVDATLITNGATIGADSGFEASSGSSGIIATGSVGSNTVTVMYNG